MKLIYKGVFKGADRLRKGVLPENAVKFNEPDSIEELETAVLWYLFPAAVIIAFAMLGSFIIHGSLRLSFSHWLGIPAGLGLSLAALIPHEILHAVCFGKAEVDLYIAPKQGLLFVYSPTPVTKLRFILMSLCPNVVLGLIPLLVWMFFPVSGILSMSLFIFSATMLTCGIGDYMNVHNAYRQMPKGSIQQLSGFNSYWFMPTESSE